MELETWWPGGIIRYDSRGRAVYVIRRQVAGLRYKVSTRAHTRSAAEKLLERFERDPEGYDPRGVSPDPIHLDAELAREFLKWSKHERKNICGWLGKQKKKKVLDWWSTKLAGSTCAGFRSPTTSCRH